MTATTLSRSERVAAIALDVWLHPKLAKDAKIDLNKLLTGKTGKAWATSKPAIKLGLDAAVKDKLAKDADISDVIEMLDRLDDVVDEEEPTPRGSDDMTGELSEDEEAQYQALAKRRTPDAAETPAEDAEEDNDEEKKKKEAEDAEEDNDDDEEEKKKKKSEWTKDKAAKDKAAKDKAAKDKAAKDKQAKDGTMITKAAMDAALAEQATKTEAATIARLAAIREAERDVRPWVGEIVIPQSSAVAVYQLALDTLKVDVKGLHPDALRPILMAQPKPGDEERRRPVRIATDSAGFEDEYTKMFPNANRLMGA